MSPSVVECETCVLPEQEPQIIGELPLESTFPLDPEIEFRAINRTKSETDPDYLTPEQLNYYQRENLVCFLCEFAGKVPYKKIPGIVTDTGRLKICNMDVLQMAEKAADIAGKGSREESELIGWQKAIDSIQWGANRVDIVSPPAIADYMLTFSLYIDDYDPRIGGRPVSQIVSRRDEQMGSLEVSRGIYQNLAQNAGQHYDIAHFSGPEDFITNPIVHHTEDSDSLARAVTSIGVDENDIVYSERFEQEVREVLEPMIQEYLRQVDELSYLSSSEKHEWPYEEKKHALDAHLHTMFSFAKRIGRELQTNYWNTDVGQTVRDIMKLQTIDPMQYYAHAEAIRQSERATITGGTSCPSLNSTSAMESLSGFSESGMSFNTAIQSFMQGESKSKKTLECTCPNCDKKVAARIENNKITCPNCKASAPYKC
ncbi:hypothetical protein IPM65_02850 [Candidatus Roizmanbacteria bacterium]|nr:MAG: hypothetical protein IPM65_02850 [Candidatus Roizmanbacteria bacterium]